MKKLLFLLLLCLIITISIFKVDATDSIFPLIGKTIIIDAGHGGKDYGASVGLNKESEINLMITLKLKKHLEKYGANVILTRKDENDLSEPNALYRKKSDFDNRIKIINNSHADMYLSIHQNYYQNSKYHGPQVFYYPKVEANEKIANYIQEGLNNYTKTKRKIKIITGTYMYNKINIKGVLIECGFLSNPKELNNLKNDKYQDELTISITKSIIKYFS